MQKPCWHNVAPALFILSILTFPAQSQPRPFEDVADELESRYQKPVTYEDPVWVWSGDLVSTGGNGRPTLIPVVRLKTLLSALAPGQVPALAVAALRQVIGEYNQTVDAPRFRVVESAYGLHIIPETIHDAAGRSVPARNPLDLRITVPRATRTARGHWRALCDALTPIGDMSVACTYVSVVGEDRLEILFALPGGSLEWGAENLTAREALIDLLEHSATTFSWRLLCLPSQGRCWLYLQGIRFPIRHANPAVRFGTLEYDRCPQCAPGSSPRR